MFDSDLGRCKNVNVSNEDVPPLAKLPGRFERLKKLLEGVLPEEEFTEEKEHILYTFKSRR